MTQQEIEKAYNHEVVRELRHMLADFYRGENFGLWLALPHPVFGKSVLRTDENR